MLISFAGVCGGLCLWIILLPQAAASPDPFVEAVVVFMNFRCFLLIEMLLDPTSFLCLPLSIAGGDIQPSLSIFHGKLVCFSLIVSDIGPLPSSHVILNM